MSYGIMSSNGGYVIVKLEETEFGNSTIVDYLPKTYPSYDEASKALAKLESRAGSNKTNFRYFWD